MSRSMEREPRHRSRSVERHRAEAVGGNVLGVIGGSGGAGASSLAAALASMAAQPPEPDRRRTSGPARVPVLIDLDPGGGGLDVALGAEAVPGARWSGLHAAGGRLDPQQLLEGLPRWRGAAFLACDGHVAPAPDAVRTVIRAARQLGPVVLDLGRSTSPGRSAALAWTSALVVVVPSEIRAVTATAAVLAAMADDGFAGATRVIVRVDDAVIGASRIADVLDLQLAGTLTRDRGLTAARDRGVDPLRMGRHTRALARDVLGWAAGLPDPPGPLRVDAAQPGGVEPDGVDRGGVDEGGVGAADDSTGSALVAIGPRRRDLVRPAVVA